MTYTVLWVPKAEQDLATLWTNAIDRDAVTRAANEIDNRLRTDPETVGEARSYDLRILLRAEWQIIRSHRVVTPLIRDWNGHLNRATNLPRNEPVSKLRVREEDVPFPFPSRIHLRP